MNNHFESYFNKFPKHTEFNLRPHKIEENNENPDKEHLLKGAALGLKFLTEITEEKGVGRNGSGRERNFSVLLWVELNG